VQAALATGRGLGVDAVVTRSPPFSFRSCHDSPHVVWVALLLQFTCNIRI
jgi:hypothetical protein